MEAFVYCWTDKLTEKLYIGAHKGTPADGYICSSKIVLQEYKKRPNDFSREILSQGTWKEMYQFETSLLNACGVVKNPYFYNLHLNNGKFYTKQHTESTKKLISISKMGNKNSVGRVPSEKEKEGTRLRSIGNKYGLGNRFTRKTPVWNAGKIGLQVAWNKGLKGVQVAWNKGLFGIEKVKHREETKRKMSGKIPWNKGMRNGVKGG